jgi:hypothetical protein
MILQLVDADPAWNLLPKQPPASRVLTDNAAPVKHTLPTRANRPSEELHEAIESNQLLGLLSDESLVQLCTLTGAWSHTKRSPVSVAM